MINKYIVLFFLAFSCSFFASAQTLTNSAYSRYGIGDLQFSSFTANKGFGGVSKGYQSSYIINYNNPASYSSLKLTAIQIGVSTNTYEQKTLATKQKINNTNFAYFTAAFPVKKWWGTSVGLLPYSAIGYKITTASPSNISGSTLSYLYKGSGGLNLFYWGNGFTLFKNFSIGANANFLFGNFTKERRAYYSDGTLFNVREQTVSNIKGLEYNFGTQYNLQLNKVWSIAIGLTYGLKSILNTSNNSIVQTYTEVNETISVKDTLQYITDIKNNIIIPQKIGGGIVLKKSEKYFVGLDYTSQNWKDFKLNGKDDSLTNSNIIGIGFQYIPDPNSLKSFFKKTQYRAGFHYSNTYLKINNTQLSDYAFSLGFGFPLKRSFSTGNVAIELGKRGTVQNNLIEEKYLKFSLGLVINDKWFIRRKID